MNRTDHSHASQPRSAAALWLEIVGPPLIWLTQFEAKYVLAGMELARKHPEILTAVALASIVLVIALALGAWRARQLSASSPLDVAAGVTERNRFMASVGLMSCALFFLIIVAQGIADFFHPPGLS